MMRLCVFADIHGNSVAFNEAYPRILSEKADMNIFLGDLCGYYFDEIEVFEKLRTIPHLIAIRGNHDQMFMDSIGGDQALRDQYLNKYGPALENFLNKDSKDCIQWLSHCPTSYVLDEVSLACYHGGPNDHLNEYIYPDSRLDHFKGTLHKNLILGHTHYPMEKYVDDKLILNPGSLGQPRNGRWPSYMVLDLPQRKIQLKEIHYNKQELIKRIDQFDQKHAYLKEVLLRGA